jgi:hypothetical protein
VRTRRDLELITPTFVVEVVWTLLIVPAHHMVMSPQKGRSILCSGGYYRANGSGMEQGKEQDDEARIGNR